VAQLCYTMAQAGLTRSYLTQEVHVSESNEQAAVLTVEEAAQLLRISRGSAYEAVRAGTIPSVRVGRSLRVPRHALEKMLSPGSEAPGSEAPGLQVGR
jgi:excisionase family DNA binding protein